jgi:hypothetical protein
MSGGVSFNQSSFNNWAEGGVNALAVTANLSGKYDHLTPKLKRAHSFQFSYGQIKQDKLDFRKAADVIYYLFQATVENGHKWKPAFAADFRTQFAPSYNYKLTTEPKISDFFAPAYFTQTLGMAYEPNPRFSQTLGFGSKETVVRIDNLRTAFGLKADQQVRAEAGLTTLTKVNRDVAKNVNWKSQLSTFWSTAKPNGKYADGTDKKKGIDARWDNLVGMKVNDYMNVNFEFSTLYDADISAKMQLREVLAVGLSYKFR